MADFLTAAKKTLSNEGGYVNNSNDRGGETICGIARQFWPSWEGWPKVDEIKAQMGSFRDEFIDLHFREMILKFYRENFWDQIAGDQIPDQDLANELFDTAVNSSPKRAIEFLQTALNLLNRNGKLYSDIIVDGCMGRQTIATTLVCLKVRGPVVLFNLLNILQGAHYVHIMQREPSQEEFAIGWLRRVEIKKI